jgi:hypothetical protein
VHEIVKRYVQRANNGDDVDVDLSVLAASLSWLPILDRPESPIAPLINTLRRVREALGEHYQAPAKPKRFRELFPDVRLYGDRMSFPYHQEILFTDGIVGGGVRFELIKTPAELQENRTFMGNCTWTYKERMEKGTHAIYRLHEGGEVYNAAMSASNGSWRVGEINSRFNRGNVPQSVRRVFEAFVRGLSADSAEAAQETAQVLRVKARFSVL